MSMHRLAASLLAFTVTALMAPGLASAAIPQDHDYQKTLRNWLASLTEADLAVELKPVEYLPEHFESAQTVARYWMLAMEGMASFPPSSGFRMPAAWYTLDAIEADGQVNLRPERGGLGDPVDLIWWTRWDYPGNPYHQHAGVRRRALVLAMVDMIMLDHHHEQGKYARSDNLGGSMIRLGYVAWDAAELLPADVRDAYFTGLTKMFERLERWTPHGSGGGDMEFFQLVGMWYAGQALGGDFPQRALKRAHHVIDYVTTDTGYEKHGAAFDVSYQGIALRFLAWAAMLYDDPKVNESLHKMLVLKSHLTLIEPNGNAVGPTHFSTGTHMDAPRDQWAWPSRDAAMAMIDDEALYTIPLRVGIPDVDDMRQSVERLIQAVKPETPFEQKIEPWRENHWTRGINYAFMHYQPGFYPRLVDLRDADSPLLVPPFSRNETFLRDLNDGGEIFAARFPSYGVVLHAGPVAARWASGVSGKSGGAMSAFWTPTRGSAVMGLTRATQSQTPDEWTDDNDRGPYTWAVHAVTGKSAEGHYFSSSRIRPIRTEGEIRHPRKTARIVVTGDLGQNAFGDPQKQLSEDVTYERVFEVREQGVTVTSSLNLPEGHAVAELWEMIPAYQGDVHMHRNEPPAEIHFQVDGAWVEAGQTIVETRSVRLRRFDAETLITFPEPVRVKLGPDPGMGSHGSGSSRNIMVDLLSQPDHAVTWTIRAGD